MQSKEINQNDSLIVLVTNQNKRATHKVAAIAASKSPLHTHTHTHTRD